MKRNSCLRQSGRVKQHQSPSSSTSPAKIYVDRAAVERFILDYSQAQQLLESKIAQIQKQISHNYISFLDQFRVIFGVAPSNGTDDDHDDYDDDDDDDDDESDDLESRPKLAKKRRQNCVEDDDEDAESNDSVQIETTIEMVKENLNENNAVESESDSSPEQVAINSNHHSNHTDNTRSQTRLSDNTEVPNMEKDVPEICNENNKEIEKATSSPAKNIIIDSDTIKRLINSWASSSDDDEAVEQAVVAVRGEEKIVIEKEENSQKGEQEKGDETEEEKEEQQQQSVPISRRISRKSGNQISVSKKVKPKSETKKESRKLNKRKKKRKRIVL